MDLRRTDDDEFPPLSFDMEPEPHRPGRIHSALTTPLFEGDTLAFDRTPKNELGRMMTFCGVARPSFRFDAHKDASGTRPDTCRVDMPKEIPVHAMSPVQMARCLGDAQAPLSREENMRERMRLFDAAWSALFYACRWSGVPLPPIVPGLSEPIDRRHFWWLMRHVRMPHYWRVFTYLPYRNDPATQVPMAPFVPRAPGTDTSVHWRNPGVKAALGCVFPERDEVNSWLETIEEHVSGKSIPRCLRIAENSAVICVLLPPQKALEFLRSAEREFLWSKDEFRASFACETVDEWSLLGVSTEAPQCLNGAEAGHLAVVKCGEYKEFCRDHPLDGARAAAAARAVSEDLPAIGSSLSEDAHVDVLADAKAAVAAPDTEAFVLPVVPPGDPMDKLPPLDEAAEKLHTWTSSEATEPMDVCATGFVDAFLAKHGGDMSGKAAHAVHALLQQLVAKLQEAETEVHQLETRVASQQRACVELTMQLRAPRGAAECAPEQAAQLERQKRIRALGPLLDRQFIAELRSGAAVPAEHRGQLADMLLDLGRLWEDMRANYTAMYSTMSSSVEAKARAAIKKDVDGLRAALQETCAKLELEHKASCKYAGEVVALDAKAKALWSERDNARYELKQMSERVERVERDAKASLAARHREADEMETRLAEKQKNLEAREAECKRKLQELDDMPQELERTRKKLGDTEEQLERARVSLDDEARVLANATHELAVMRSEWGVQIQETLDEQAKACVRAAQACADAQEHQKRAVAAEEKYAAAKDLYETRIRELETQLEEQRAKYDRDTAALEMRNKRYFVEQRKAVDDMSKRVAAADELARKELAAEFKHASDARQLVEIDAKRNDAVLDAVQQMYSGALCSICQEKPVTHAYAPCGHVAACAQCHEKFRERRHEVKCPKCSSEAEGFVKIVRADCQQCHSATADSIYQGCGHFALCAACRDTKKPLADNCGLCKNATVRLVRLWF